MAVHLTQKGIPFLYIRGGTSKGPYFNSVDLPEGEERLSNILISVIGAGNSRNIDGIGGGSAVSTKVAILSRSTSDDADVDYLFAQVSVIKKLVDFSPTCGNILVGVGPAAIEMGLVPITGDQTKVRIRASNTGALVESIVQTPNGAVDYQGQVAIDGVPGTAAPVALNFLNVVGAKTGRMFPTGSRIDVINGVSVSCLDVAMPMMIARAEDFGITGYETSADLDQDANLLTRMEEIRLIAGTMMGLGDCTDQVIPKVGLIAPARHDGHFSARYFMPWTAHPTLAITGSQCLAACALAPGTVAEGLVKPVGAKPVEMKIEHPMGLMTLAVDYALSGDDLSFNSAGVVRTARLIAEGKIFVPSDLL